MANTGDVLAAVTAKELKILRERVFWHFSKQGKRHHDGDAANRDKGGPVTRSFVADERTVREG